MSTKFFVLRRFLHGSRWKLVLIDLTMPNSIVHFEIPADNLQRAKEFYEDTLGGRPAIPGKGELPLS